MFSRIPSLKESLDFASHVRHLRDPNRTLECVALLDRYSLPMPHFIARDGENNRFFNMSLARRHNARGPGRGRGRRVRRRVDTVLMAPGEAGHK